MHPISGKVRRSHGGGCRRVFRQFSWLKAGSGKTALSRPIHQRVTRAVGPPEEAEMMLDIRTHSTRRTLTLHLLPGALITAFYFIAAPLVMRAGYPSIMALLLAILLILIPFELGYLLYEGKRTLGASHSTMWFCTATPSHSGTTCSSCHCCWPGCWRSLPFLHRWTTT